MTPSASFLLPVRNVAETLPACLRSLQRQTVTDWECIVIDDGSTDDTAGVLRRVANDDARFRILHGDDAGIVAALRAGTDVCRGDVVVRMDGDDVAHRRRLELQLDALDRTEAGLVGCHPHLFPDRNLGPGMQDYGAWLRSIGDERELLHQRFIECPLAHPTFALRRSLLDDFPYRDRDWPEDWDLLLRLCGAGVKVDVVPRQLLAWRRHPQSLSRTHGRYSIEAFTRCRAAFLVEGPLRDRDTYVLWGYGATGRGLAKELRALGAHAAYIIDVHPGRLGQKIHGAEVVAPKALPDIDVGPILVSVANVDARQLIQEELAQIGRGDRILVA